MAERFVRYEQQLGKLNIPDVDFAAEKEIARGYNKISGQLDRMSQFFMGQAETQFKLEGAEYGAANAPTEQQIQDAYKDGEQIELVGDNFSVYGRAARQSAMNAATDEIEFLAKKEILTYMTEAERGEYDVSIVNDKIDTIIAGYSSILDDTSPGNAKRLRANLGLFGYGKSQTHASDMIKINRQREISSFSAAYQLSLEGISDIIRNATSQEIMLDEATAIQRGETPGQPITVGAADVADAVLDKELNYILKRATGLRMSKSQIDNIVTTWNNEVERAQVAIVMGEVIGHEAPRELLTNMTNAVREMNKGGGTQYREQLPPQLAIALQLAKPEKRAELLDLARTSWRTTIEDSQKQISYDNNIREREVRRVNSSFTRGLSVENISLMNAAAIEMNNFDPVRAEAMTELVDKIQVDGFSSMNIDNVGIRQKFETDLVNPNPEYDLTDLVKARTDGKLSHKTFIELAEKYEAQYDDNFKAALDEVKAIVGIPQNAYADSSFLDSVANQIYTSIETQLLKARRQDTTGEFDPQVWVDNNLEDFYTKVTQDVTDPIKVKAKKMSRRTAELIRDKAANESDDALFSEMQDLIEQVDELLEIDPELNLPGWMD